MSRALVLGLVVSLGVIACDAPASTNSPAPGRPEPSPSPSPSPEPSPEPVEEVDAVETSESAAATEAVTDEPAEGGFVIHGNPDATKWERTAKVPTVTRHEPEVGTPAIPGEVIRRVVRSHIEALRACYQLGLDVDPELMVRLAISFTIGPSGAVEEATVEAPEGFPFPELPKCIADEMLTWTFPAPRGGGKVIVSYPTNLVPN